VKQKSQSKGGVKVAKIKYTGKVGTGSRAFFQPLCTRPKHGYMKEKYLQAPYQRNGYTWHEAVFPNIISFYEYLKSSPQTIPLSAGKRKSLLKNKRFCGAPLPKAIDYIVAGYNSGFEQFLELKKELDSKIIVPSNAARYKKTSAGSRVHVPSAIAGSPEYMLKPVRREERKFVNIHFNLSYIYETKQQIIRNRGLIALNLIDLLQSNNYKVNLKAFDISSYGDEIVCITIGLKNFEETINVSNCYYPFVAKEFCRRLLFYCLETMNVKNDWYEGYGHVFRIEEIRGLLGILEGEIVFGSPKEMGITRQLNKSVDTVFKKINLDQYIRLRR
jgi:hypothetical protein